MTLSLVPITIQDAKIYVRRHHRHLKPPVSGLFAVAVESEGEIVGVAIIGRPVARMLADGYTAEVNRVATDGTKNACSMLYGAAWRACRALGYQRLVTYIREDEPGTTMAAAGWSVVHQVAAAQWTRDARPRVQNEAIGKQLWEMAV